MPRRGEQQTRQLGLGKICSGCNDWKPLDEFSERREMVDGRRSQCRDCDRARGKAFRERDPAAYREYLRQRYHSPERVDQAWNSRLKNLYGMTVERYVELLDDQGGVCAICKGPQKSGQRKRLYVDHDHGTGKVRGLLCGTCNAGIAMLKESEEIMHSAMAYLFRHSSCKT
jgi:hypothetical protein